MKVHGNARTCLHSRLLMVRRVREEEWTLAQAAEAAGVSVRTVSKWLRCYDREGEEGLLDRSSAPRTVANRTPEDRIRVIAALRRLHMTGAEIAELLTMPLSTVSVILTRIGLGRLSRLEPREPANRYEKSRAGELVHVDVKKLGRIARPGHRVTGRVSGGGQHRRAFELGWEFVHVAIDDATRLAYAEVLADEKGRTAAAFLRRAVAFFASFGIRVERVMSDNGPAYRSVVHALAAGRLGSSTRASAPTGRARTGRPSVSSAPCSAAGPTERSTATQPSARALSTAGSSSTIDADHTAASTANRPSSAYEHSGTTWLGLTSRVRLKTTFGIA